MSARETELRFKPIDLEAAAEIAIRFRADSYFCSFGSTERFDEADGKGPERYLVWLAERMRALPGSCVHVRDGQKVVGQIELSLFTPDPQIGYVNLYYLVPGYRNRGLGARLDDHATSYFRGLGLGMARLNVSPTNEQAMKFYLKNGWRTLGPRENHPEVHWMEKDLRRA